MSDTTLDGQVAVVTGAGRGIGRALAVGFAARGANVVVSARSPGDLQAVLDRVHEAGSSGISVTGDATDPDVAREPVREAIASYGRVDILVNNLGGRIPGSHDVFACDPEIVEQELSLNLLSGWWTTREALPHMRMQEYGRILNLGSGSTRHSGSRLGYTIAKHGILGMTRALAAETAKHGITVNCLSPGWTDTSMHDWERMADEGNTTVEEFRRSAAQANLQQRILGAEELVPMAVLLCSKDAGRSVTGQEICVDGGYKV